MVYDVAYHAETGEIGECQPQGGAWVECVRPPLALLTCMLTDAQVQAIREERAVVRGGRVEVTP